MQNIFGKIMEKIKFWKFWTILVLMVFVLATGHFYFGLFEFIQIYDQTMLTFVNIGILVSSHILLGWKYYTKQYTNNDMLYFMSESVISIGLIGTLSGFMIVLWAVFGPGVILDPSDTLAMTTALAMMAQGMSAALITSLSGIVASVIINLQIVVLES